MVNPTKRLLLGLTLGFALLDQLSKWLAKTGLPPEESLPIIPGVFQLTLAYNTGAAFSLLRHQPQLLTLVTSTIFLILLTYALTRRQFARGEVPALGLILGGALGNLIDRFLAGKVTDFFDVIAIHYPVFNVADSFIFCGVLWLIFIHLFQPQTETKAPANEASHWERFNEHRVNKWSDQTTTEYDVEGVRREDGFTLIRESRNREGVETFLGRTKTGEFKFEARRWDEWSDKPWDYYIVYTNSYWPDWKPLEEQTNTKHILAHAEDIESALLHFPVDNGVYNNVPVKKVLFDQASPTTAQQLVSAEDIQSNPQIKG